METEFCQKLKEGISIIINNWPVLQTALSNNWVQKNYNKIQGSEETSNVKQVYQQSNQDVKNQFIQQLTDFVYNFDCSNEDLEDFIYDYMSETFFLQIEDESDKQVLLYKQNFQEKQILNKKIASGIIDLVHDLEKGSDKVLNEYKELAIKYFKKIQENIQEAQIQNAQEITEDNNENDEDLQDDQEENQQEKLIDEDGFQIIQSQKNKKSKKNKNPQQNIQKMEEEEEVKQDKNGNQNSLNQQQIEIEKKEQKQQEVQDEEWEDVEKQIKNQEISADDIYYEQKQFQSEQNRKRKRKGKQSKQVNTNNE